MDELNALNQQEVNEMFNHLVYILKKNAISWVATDDINISIDKKDYATLDWLRYQVESNKYKLVRVGNCAKLKKDDLWIDIFLSSPRPTETT